MTEIANATTDWIIAVSGIFAALGTVGAVIVALWQVLAQGRPRVYVECRGAVAPGMNLVSLRATNASPRPVKLLQAYLVSSDGRQIFSVPIAGADALPAHLTEGESVEILWNHDALVEAKTKEGFGGYAYAYFADAVGREFSAPYLGMRRVRRGPPWRRRTRWVPRRQETS